MDRENPQDDAAAKGRSAITDVAGILLVGIAVWRFVDNSAFPYSGVAILITGLMALSVNRRTHRSPKVAKLARHIWAFSPTAVIMTFAAAALSDFGRYLTQADFGMFYSSALQLRADPGRLYDVDAQNRMLALVTGGLKNHYLSFPYPPFVAVLFVPLSYLGFGHAYRVMLAINLVLLVAIVTLLCRRLCKGSDQVLVVVLSVSVLLPVYVNLVLGQVAFLGLFLFSLFALDLLAHRTTRAGFWVALLSCKLTLVPIPLVLLLARRAWRGLTVACFAMMVLFGLSVALVGPDGMRANLHVMTMMTDSSLIPRMQSLRALTHFLGMPVWVFWALGLLIIGSLLVTDYRGGRPRWVLAAAVLAALLASPYVQSYDLSLAVLALALAVSELRSIPDWKRAGFLLLAFLPGFVALAGQVTGRNWPAAPACLVVLFAYCLYRAGGEGAPR